MKVSDRFRPFILHFRGSVLLATLQYRKGKSTNCVNVLKSDNGDQENSFWAKPSHIYGLCIWTSHLGWVLLY